VTFVTRGTSGGGGVGVCPDKRPPRGARFWGRELYARGWRPWQGPILRPGGVGARGDRRVRLRRHLLVGDLRQIAQDNVIRRLVPDCDRSLCQLLGASRARQQRKRQSKPCY